MFNNDFGFLERYRRSANILETMTILCISPLKTRWMLSISLVLAGTGPQQKVLEARCDFMVSRTKVEKCI